MALCKSFDNLSHVEKVIFIGQLTHAAMNSDECFDIAQGLIKLGHYDGVFTNVVINPPSENGNAEM
jgi:hypothetical protein